MVSQIWPQDSQEKHNKTKSVILTGRGHRMPCMATEEDFGEEAESRSEGKAETKTLRWNFQRKTMAGDGGR